MRDEYELDELLAADFDGQLWWLVRRASDWILGPTVGPLFSDAMRAGWDTIHPEVEWA